MIVIAIDDDVCCVEELESISHQISQECLKIGLELPIPCLEACYTAVLACKYYECVLLWSIFPPCAAGLGHLRTPRVCVCVCVW